MPRRRRPDEDSRYPSWVINGPSPGQDPGAWWDDAYQYVMHLFDTDPAAVFDVFPHVYTIHTNGQRRETHAPEA